jgi:hypothetical protein
MRQAARAIAAGRIAFGVGALIAPRRIAAGWVGRDGTSDGATVLIRALAGRDLLLGFMALHTLDHPPVAARWQASLAAVDAVDGLATLAVRSSPPVAALALGTAVFEAVIARRLNPAGS